MRQGRSERTRTDYLRYLVPLRAVFGAMVPRSITPPDVAWRQRFPVRLTAKTLDAFGVCGQV